MDDNLIYSNNKNIFSDDRDEYCKQPAEDRDPTVVCPTFQVPVGTGILIAGGNDNIVEGNYIFDNWRRGTMLHWVPASFRGENDPAKANDTSNNNAYVDNCMGIRPPSWGARLQLVPGHRDANGVDFWWDEEEGQDCDAGPARLRRLRDPEGELLDRQRRAERRRAHRRPAAPLPACPGVDTGFSVPEHRQAPRADPVRVLGPATNTDPPGCDWFTTPPEPQLGDEPPPGRGSLGALRQFAPASAEGAKHRL